MIELEAGRDVKGDAHRSHGAHGTVNAILVALETELTMYAGLVNTHTHVHTNIL